MATAKVKKADIEDNINILRLKSVTDKDLKRVATIVHGKNLKTAEKEASKFG